MRKVIVFENSSCYLEQVDIEMINTLMEISQQVKENLGLPYQPIRFDSTSRIFIERIIGNISYNDFNLVILPKVIDVQKFDKNRIDSAMKQILLRTLKCSGDKINSTIFFTKNSLVDDQGIFLEVLARYYCESLKSALKLGPITTYQTHQRKVNTIKGQILVQKQLSEPITDEKVWCKYKKISSNNTYNQLLVWACKYLLTSIRDFSTKKQLNALLMELNCSDNNLTKQVVLKLRLPRQFGMYKECFSIARNLYLKSSGKRVDSTGKNVCGYVISTERAFEAIVERYCHKAASILGYAHRAQAMTQLASASVGRNYDYYIIPDNLVFSNDKQLVVDAKYKLLKQEGSKSRPLREDFYQMISSCIAHDAHEAVLIYPKATGSCSMFWKILEKINGKNYIIRSAFIDIFESDSALLENMKKILMNTEFYGR